MNFASDNVYGVHPQILAALGAVNESTAPSYANDPHSKAAEQRLSEIFERPVKAFLVVSGTAANGLALSAVTQGFGAVICHAEAHVYCDECNSPEFFTGGAKMIGLQGPAGKLTPALIDRTLKSFIRGEHDPKPRAVALTNASELGTVYTPAEVKAVSDLIRPRGMKLFMDGARFANALVSLGCMPAEITWKAGVDLMSFGATKNGAMMLEAVIFFDAVLAEDFLYRRMRGGQLISKSRYLGAQMLAYLKDDLWLANARTANGLARTLADGLAAVAGVRIPHPVEANEVFAVMPRRLYDGLQAEGAVFYDWMPDSLGGAMAESEIFARFVLSYATPTDAVRRFIDLARRLAR